MLSTLMQNSNAVFCPLQAIQIQEEADRLLQQHRDLMEDVDQQKRDAEDMLENGVRQQQVRVTHSIAASNALKQLHTKCSFKLSYA